MITGTVKNDHEAHSYQRLVRAREQVEAVERDVVYGVCDTGFRWLEDGEVIDASDQIFARYGECPNWSHKWKRISSGWGGLPFEKDKMWPMRKPQRSNAGDELRAGGNLDQHE